MERLSRILLFAIAALLMLVSCEADKIGYGASCHLAFSCDTLSFDTLFTGMTSATKSFKIYNHEKNKLVISNIELSSDEHFAINLNGMKGTSFKDVVINAHDSMVVFVQVNIDISDETLPFLIEDSISFLTNGNRQRVLLEAYGRNAVRISNRHISADETFTSVMPYLISDTLFVDNGATLTLEAGTCLYFRKKGTLVVDGTLRSEGVRNNWVVIRGDRSDYMNTVPPITYDLVSGQWNGILFRSGSADNVMRFTDVRNPINGIVADTTELVVESCVLRNSQNDILLSNESRIVIGNSLIYNAGGFIFNLYGGNFRLLQSTVANYYNFSWGSRTQPILSADGAVLDIRNSIVYGNYTTELLLASDYPLSDYLVGYSVIKSAASNINERYVNCAVNVDPLFAFKGWSDEERSSRPCQYDFHILYGSPAIGKAQREVAELYPYDLDGNDRLSDGTSDAGCFEYR